MGLTGKLYRSLPCRVRRKLLRWGGRLGRVNMCHMCHTGGRHQNSKSSGRSGLGGSPGLGGGPDLAKNALEHTLSVALDAEGVLVVARSGAGA